MNNEWQLKLGGYSKLYVSTICIKIIRADSSMHNYQIKKYLNSLLLPYSSQLYGLIKACELSLMLYLNDWLLDGNNPGKVFDLTRSVSDER